MSTNPWIPMGRASATNGDGKSPNGKVRRPMTDQHKEFWIDLLRLGEDADQRARLWNGYLGEHLPDRVLEPISSTGCPKLIVEPPPCGWPCLTTEERQAIKELVEKHGGHPDFEQSSYMDFIGHVFRRKVDFSGHILINCRFDAAQFLKDFVLDKNTRIYGESRFRNTVFYAQVHSNGARFSAPVYFSCAKFNTEAKFLGVEFAGGASFADAVFQGNVMFDDSRFELSYFSGSEMPRVLTSFVGAKFKCEASFRNVRFGTGNRSKMSGPERSADFTSAEFMQATNFYRATFVGPPAFFETKLHEDTDFGQVEWPEPRRPPFQDTGYAVRAWEKLELMMNKLEKPFDRARFFRFKMRARRRTQKVVLRILNWLFDKSTHFGWSVERAFLCWFGHWFGFSLVLYLSTEPEVRDVDSLGSFVAALGTSFSNAHAFLGLAGENGYLEGCRTFMDQNAVGILTPLVGTVETIVGPVLLFLLLLAIRNRFRLG